MGSLSVTRCAVGCIDTNCNIGKDFHPKTLYQIEPLDWSGLASNNQKQGKAIRAKLLEVHLNAKL
jgi:hypothetical protein